MIYETSHWNLQYFCTHFSNWETCGLENRKMHQTTTRVAELERIDF